MKGWGCTFQFDGVLRCCLARGLPAAERRKFIAWRREPQVTAMAQSELLLRTSDERESFSRQRIGVDIKPSNLMLARDGNKPVVKVLDFGLAKVTSEGGVDGGLTQEGQMLGAPHYVAPEQTVNAQKADIRADIYSLGCTLYCLLTGHPPFDAPKPVRAVAGAPLDGCQAAKLHSPRSARRAGRRGGEDAGQRARAAVPDSGRGSRGAQAVLQAGREPGVQTEPRDLPRRAGGLVSPACRRWVRTGAAGDPRHGPSPRAKGSVKAEPRSGGVGEPDRVQANRNSERTCAGRRGAGASKAAVDVASDRRSFLIRPDRAGRHHLRDHRLWSHQDHRRRPQSRCAGRRRADSHQDAARVDHSPRRYA